MTYLERKLIRRYEGVVSWVAAPCIAMEFARLLQERAMKTETYELQRRDGDRGWSTVTECPSLADALARAKLRHDGDPSYPETRVVRITREVVSDA